MISIIIPTYNHLEDCLRPCLDSIIQYTDLQDVEIIVVANGCGKDGTFEYIEYLHSRVSPNIKGFYFKEALGFTKAINEGIKVSKGEYIVLLNNDLQIMGDNWLQMLISPFLVDNTVGITGAAKNYHKETESEFILFFCAMLKREILERVGGIDEIFNPGYGEDIDYCCKIQRMGYRVVQVPNDISLTDVRNRDDHTLQFPIWHKGSTTVSEVPEWNEIVPRNEEILLKRYAEKYDRIDINNLLDTVSSWEILPRLDKITSFIKEDGQLLASLDKRTSLTLSRGGFANGCFIGTDGVKLLKYEYTVCDIYSQESIKEFVLLAGSKNLQQFGGRWQGGYCMQQDVDEVSQYLFDCSEYVIDHYLEIGVADGAVTRLFCDVAQVKDITTIDIGWADMNYPLNYRNNLLNTKNHGKIDIYRGDSHAPEADKFLDGKKFDFIFIDAGHEYEDVVQDTNLAKKHAKSGAIFAYHDHVACEGVTRFFNEICKSDDMKLIATYESPNPDMRKGISVFKYLPKIDDNMKDISIIIPTYNHLDDCLKPCLQSIINTTPLDNLEVIVVANGCTDKTREYVEGLGGPFRLIWIDEQVGFIKATNEGIKASIGRYVVLLNNDTEVLNSTWLDKLKKPLLEDMKVGITGPYKDWRFYWDNDVLTFREEYIVFYCAMIRRTLIDKIGLLDEDYGMGYEEDIDYCIRAKKAGYKLQQVPTDIKDELQLNKQYLSTHPNQLWREFPLIHKDKQSFDNNFQDNSKKTSLLQKFSTKPRISVIISHYKNLDLLKGCVESIKRYTDLSEFEIIIVANGCTNETRQYVHSLGSPFKLLWFDEPVGFIKANNAGIKESMGDFVILLNDDTELRPQEKDEWIKLLLTRFVDNVGIVGPIKAWRDDVRAEYLLFWCVMIKREVIQKVGLLDEAFGEGYHEDVDYCIRTQRAGYKIVETPEDINYTHDDQGDKNRQGSFPIIHVGGGTFGALYGNAKDIQEKNLHHLYNKYSPILEKELPGGWFGWDDQAFYKELIKNIPDGSTIAEIGIWMGRSICSVADVIKKKNLHVCAIDTFEGSPWEIEDGAQTKGIDLEKVFRENLERFGLSKYVTVYKASSIQASKYFVDKSFEFIFIDADHRYESVQADIKAWLPKIKDNYVIAGHDIQWNDSVAPAVFDLFGQENVYTGANIWYILPQNRYKKYFKYSTPKGKVIDTCIFYNEVELFKLRVEELYNVVDKFVVVESLIDHQGNPKPAYFDWDSLGDKRDKVHYILLREFPNCISTWDREHYQRRAIMDGLAECQPNDIIILSDCDEIVSKLTVQEYTPDMGVCAIDMPLFYYKLDWQIQERWFKARIFPFSALNGKTMQDYRGKDDYVYNRIIPNGGWHFSFLGDAKSVKQKIQAYSHEEFNNDNFTNDKHIEDAILNGKDIFRRNLNFKKVTDFSEHPRYVQDHLDYYKSKDLISSRVDKGYKVYDCFSFFNELDLLEVRLNELDKYVDYFVLSEMDVTHSGKPKPLYFAENKGRFTKWLHKIKHVIPQGVPNSSDPWVREHYQRDYMMNALKDCSDEDVIIVSDLDEIPRGSKIIEANYTPKCFEQNQFNYFLNYNVGISPVEEGTFSRIVKYQYLRINKLSLTSLRYIYLTNSEKIPDGGWHFSWMGGAKNIVKKLEAWAHQELNALEYKDTTRINYLISEGKEHFGRTGDIITKKWEIDESFPIFVQENQDYLTELGLLDVSKVAIIMPYYNDDMLLKSVSAITNQSFLNWELFIADDGSTDDKQASKILASHPKIHHYWQRSQGPATARNNLLDKVVDKDFTHIAFCDSDDIWDKDYLMKQLNFIGDNDIVYSSVRHQFEDGREAIPYGITDFSVYPGRRVMLDKPFIFISSVVLKTNIIKNYRFDYKLDSIEDWDMWLKLDENGYIFTHNPEKLLTYTVKNGMAAKRTEEKVQLLKTKHTT